MSEMKMSKPEVDMHYLRPIAAERKLRMAAGINQTVWCCGVCGIGKTSFIADYLKRRRYDYYSAKEIIPQEVQIPKPTDKTYIIVIDDLYGITEVEIQNEWKEIIGLLMKRDDIWLILISRSDIPSWLHTLSVQYIFYRIEEKELLLTKKQVDEYLSMWKLDPEEETRERMWQLGSGSPLWYRICAIELTRALTDTEISQEEKCRIETLAIKAAQENIWKYLNIHVYDQWASEVTENIMKLSLFEEFDLDMAVFMTGNSKINIMLQAVMELGSFITRFNHLWKIRTPVRLSMIQRLQQNYDTEYLNQLFVRAGDCLKIKGKLMEALALYEKAKNEQCIAELLIQNGRENPSTGYYYEMRHYYIHLSEDYIKASVELMGSMSMLQSMLMNKEESERWYDELKEYSKNQTGSLKKEAQNYLLYLDISLPHRGNLDLIELMKHAGSLLINRKVRLPEFSVTSNLPSLMNGGKDFCEWSKRDKELALTIAKPVCLVLGKYGKGLVSLALAESGFEKGEDNYEIEALAIRGRMEAEAGGKIEQCFVSIGILIWLTIFTNHPENVKVIMNGFQTMMEEETVVPQLVKNFDTMNCRVAMYQGRTTTMSEWMKDAPDENQEFYCMDRFRYLTKVRVYLADHKYREAEMLLQKLMFYAQENKRTYIQMEVMLLQSILYYRMGNDKWQSFLQQTITEAEDYHFVRLLSREGVALLPLLRKGDFLWKDKKYKKQVEEETTYLANIYPSYLSATTENAMLLLSENPLKILRLQVLGKTTEEIAKELDISPATVKYHNKETYRKLGVKTKAQAINEARNKKLI